MRPTQILSLGIVAGLVAVTSAQADVPSSSLAVQSTMVASFTQNAANNDLAAARPDLSLSGNGFTFGSNSNNSTPIGVRAQNFMGPPQQLAYYGAAFLNYLLTPPADTRGHDNYLLITYPGYAVSTWTDRVAGAPSMGLGSATDEWTASVYYMARTHPSSAPDEHPVLNVMPKFHAHPELDNHNSFRPPH